MIISEGTFLKSNSFLFILNFLILLALHACTSKGVYNDKRKVFIEEKEGKFTLMRNGKPYSIKGAAGHTYLKKLNQVGGNTIRIYDTTNIGSVLDEAEANRIAVVVGIPLVSNKKVTGFYNDTAKVGAQFRAFKKIVEKYKDHPAVLMWCMGNELDFKFKLKYWNFYKEYNKLVDMVHNIDPNHPVTTTIMNVRRQNICNIELFTKTDIISFNSFGGTRNLRKDLKAFSWFWKGAYLILEWGIEGPWRPNENKTIWEAFIESTSSKKVEQYLQTYKQDLPVEDTRFLGAFIFYWGQKQEYTPTWFSTFYEDGSMSEVVGLMKYLWTGKWPEHPAPQINYMLVDKKGALDNLIYKAGRIANAELFMAKSDSSISNIKWELYHEDWYQKDNVKNQKKLVPIDSLFVNCNAFKATFKTPLEEGPYRLYATVFDRFGYFATCNTPFYVVR